LSKLPFSFLLSRLRYPGIFILGVVIVLPFLAGETVLFSWGIFQLKLEGILTVVLIVTRFLCILTTTLILFSTAPFLTTLQTLRSLGLSPIINDMMLLTYRYLQEIGESLTTMQRALKLKGFNFNQFSQRNLEIVANLIAILLIRSYEQSKLVYQAMILRGYGTNLDKTNNYSNKINYFHWIACCAILVISITLIVLQHIIV
jgi:cobalt/nickel transport system permease protein